MTVLLVKHAFENDITMLQTVVPGTNELIRLGGEIGIFQN